MKGCLKMKIRNGFVSNSSSSSFIISYEEKEELLNNVKKMMKRYKTKGMDKIEKEEYLNCYNSQLDKWLHVDTVGDIKDKLNLPYWHRGCDIAYNLGIGGWEEMNYYYGYWYYGEKILNYMNVLYNMPTDNSTNYLNEDWSVD